LGNTFVTYSVLPGFGNGFRALAAADFENAGTVLASGAVTLANNVRYASSVALTFTGSAHAANSFVVDNSSTTAGTLLAVSGSGTGDSLALASGALLFAGSATPQPVTFGGFASGITTSASEYVFTQNNLSAAGVLLSSPLTSAAGLIKSGPGILKLTGNNSSLTSVTVNQGTLGIASQSAINGLTVSLKGGALGLLTDGDGTGSRQTVVVDPVNVMLSGDAGLTVDRLGMAVTGYGLTSQFAANKTVQWGGALGGFTNQVLTITNANGFGLDMTADLALTTAAPTLDSPAPTFNVVNATVAAMAQGLTISGRLTGGATGAGVASFVKSGAGTLVLTNSGNTFGGSGSVIDVQQGVLSVGADAPLGDAANVVKLNPATGTATLRATETFTLNHAVALAGTANTRAIEVSPGKTLTLGGSFQLDGGSGAYANLVKADLGTLTFAAGVTNASWAGTLTVNSGVVLLQSGGSLGSAAVVIPSTVNNQAIQLSGGITVANSFTSSANSQQNASMPAA
jgi:autotransporter-associated beta strand protein